MTSGTVKSARVSALEAYQPACVSPTGPMRRIAVLTTGPASRELVSAVRKMTPANDIVRFVECDELSSASFDEPPAGLDNLSPWWEWADVVVTDASDDSIAESVELGFVPVVAVPRKRLGSGKARRALSVIHPWSSRGLALHLCLDKPSHNLLESAAHLRTTVRTAPVGIVWNCA